MATEPLSSEAVGRPVALLRGSWEDLDTGDCSRIAASIRPVDLGLDNARTMFALDLDFQQAAELIARHQRSVQKTAQACIRNRQDGLRSIGPVTVSSPAMVSGIVVADVMGGTVVRGAIAAPTAVVIIAVVVMTATAAAMVVAAMIIAAASTGATAAAAA